MVVPSGARANSSTFSSKQFDCDVSMLIERISGSCKSISSKSIQLLILLVTNCKVTEIQQLHLKMGLLPLGL